jgi:DNA-binding CsgD family transcriptional regulator
MTGQAGRPAVALQMPDRHTALAGAQEPRLVGRDAELAQLGALLLTGRSASAALLVLGDAGLGKSALLRVAIARARGAGTRVLAASGVQAESELAFAGLHQLLLPVLSELDRLPGRQAAALRCAFGLSQETTPDRFLIGLASLTLLAEVADQQSLLVVVDDAAWFDRGSLEALAFAVRRLHAERIAVIVASRDDEALTAFGRDMPRLALGPLDDQASRQLLETGGRELPSNLCARVLAEAAGNPLALLELGSTVAGPAGGTTLPVALPPPARLERVFSERLAGLREPTRRMLTLAACADGNDVRPVATAAEAVGLAVDALREAEAAGLVTFSSEELVFRHPLIRSVIYHAAPFAERRAAHLALAEALLTDPDRRAWHLAAVTLKPDEPIAALLEASAERSRVRAGYAAAASALERAAQLSPEPFDQARRLALATDMAFAAGRSAWVVDLATRVHALTDDPRLRGRAAQCVAQTQALVGRVGGSGPDVLSSAALEAVLANAPDIAVARLVVAAGYAFLMGDRELRSTAQRLARAVPGPGDEPWRLFVLAACDPAEHAQALSDGVRAVVAEAPEQPEIAKMMAQVAWFADDPASAAVLLGRAVEDMRGSGDVGALGPYLALLGFTDVWRGRWSDARALAAETVRLANDIGQPNMVAFGTSLDALVVALQGDGDAARDRAAAAIALSPAGLVVAVATWALGLAALAVGRHGEAHEHLQRMVTPDAAAAHFAVSRWAIGDVVEAAAHAGGTDGLAALIADAERQAEAGASVRARLVCRRAKALLASGESADALFQAAVATVGADEWPFEQARTHLSYGEWLRRHRRIVAARPVLRAALDSFSQLGARSWAERARNELRAAGVPLEGRPSVAVEELTPQQRQIAQLAARGLTNREIAARLFLSPRTVGFHLYNVFPKLQVTSRAQLVRVLGDGEAVGLKPPQTV